MRIEQASDASLERLANAKLAELGAVWAEVDRRAGSRDSVKRDWRRSMALHSLPGSYASDDLPPRPFTLRRAEPVERRPLEQHLAAA